MSEGEVRVGGNDENEAIIGWREGEVEVDGGNDWEGGGRRQ